MCFSDDTASVLVLLLRTFKKNLEGSNVVYGFTINQLSTYVSTMLNNLTICMPREAGGWEYREKERRSVMKKNCGNGTS